MVPSKSYFIKTTLGSNFGVRISDQLIHSTNNLDKRATFSVVGRDGECSHLTIGSSIFECLETHSFTCATNCVWI